MFDRETAVALVLANAMLALVLGACATDGSGGKQGSPDTNLDIALSAAADGSQPYQGDLRLEAPEEGLLTRATPYHIWSVELPVGAEVAIDLTSQNGDDLFLVVYRLDAASGEYLLVASNDDCQPGLTLNACHLLQATVSGRYVLAASTWDYVAGRKRAVATYGLLATCLNGACDAPIDGIACGSRGLAPCPDGMYCNWDTDGTSAACGANDGPGVCEVVPWSCTQDYAPVCGCDGTTYENECFAASHGVDVSASGDCVRKTCGGIAGLACPAGQVCDYSENDGCFADMAGVCVSGDAFSCPLQVAPVCGCDGQTYGNDCERRAARVALDHAGACDVNQACGSRGLPACAAGTYCDWDTDGTAAACGATDVPGVCRPVPTGCFDLYAPVCGCDGVTYSNECYAAAAGVDVAQSGACP